MTELDVARQAALAAATILRDRGDGPRDIGHKGAVDLVTEVDLACERAVREVLARETPGIAVLAEEGGGAAGARTRWVVDPLDGTNNFVHGFPYYCVSVALEADGVARVGVVVDPVRDRTYEAVRGQGARCNGRPMRVSRCADLGAALVGTGFPYDRRERAAAYLRPVQAVLEQARGLRRAGAAALDLAMVADGCLDAFWEFGLQRWDVAAGALLVEEAGGRFTGHDGGHAGDGPVHPLATNGRLHEAMMALLSGASPPRA